MTEKAREVFASDRYAALTGIVIDAVGTDEATCSLTLDERHLNARGVAMGGVLFTLADFAAAVAANRELCWVSLDSSIHFLAPATGNGLTAHCIALKKGRTTALFQTTITRSDNGKTVAIAETTMIKASS
ncbi:MAG: PaaI family thioesterase [Bacteroidales bacterium]|nr:PaaI family thioesterase [Bacteroidales bacterium]